MSQDMVMPQEVTMPWEMTMPGDMAMPWEVTVPQATILHSQCHPTGHRRLPRPGPGARLRDRAALRQEGPQPGGHGRGPGGHQGTQRGNPTPAGWRERVVCPKLGFS